MTPETQVDQPVKATRKPRIHDAGVKAMETWAKALQNLPENKRRAAIYWLADFYLGIKWWGR